MTQTERRKSVFSLAALLVAALMLAGAPAAAEKPPVYSETGKYAVKGADVVAYFGQRRAVYGKARFAHKWRGTTWLFASAANLAKFKANPAKYAPQYGGYCAYAVSQGYTAKIEPEAWSIVNGKLYLNYSLGVRALWALSKRRHIRQANGNWPAVLSR
jgi:YHS domain-containing protein